MPNIDRVRVTWKGFPGADGVSTFYFTSAPPHLAALHAFFVSLSTGIPTDVTLRVDSSGDTIDPLSGLIVGQWAGSPTAAIPGQSSGGYPAPTGMVVRWNTATVLSGRRLRGRTFIVPLGGALFQTDGTIVDATVAVVQAAATDLVTASAGELLVHNRPTEATPQWTDVHGRVHPAKPSKAGGFSAVTSAIAVDKAVVLRSRRD